MVGGEEDRAQPEFSTGERLSRLEALYEAFLRSEETWQEQLDRRMRGIESDTSLQREERRAELAAVRNELVTQLASTDKAIVKAEQAQDKQNELTREDAQRARASMELRVLALERGESTSVGLSEGARRLQAAQIATIGVMITFGILIVAGLSFLAAHT